MSHLARHDPIVPVPHLGVTLSVPLYPGVIVAGDTFEAVKSL